MLFSIKVRTLLLTSFLLAIVSNNAFAEANKVVVIPMAGDSVPAQALPIAYGYIKIPTGGVEAPSIITGYNVSTVTRQSEGFYIITLAKNFVGAPVVVVTSLNNTAETEVATYNFTNPNIIRIRTVDENNTLIDTNFSFIVYGTPQ